jgi:tripartite-type tricarboxylate transporter receptor subunit TctC
LKSIAISGDSRLPVLAEVPTFKEAGLPGFEMSVTYGVLAPAATPKTAIEKMSAEFGKAVAMPDMREKLAVQGMIPFYSTPEQLAAMFKADLAKYAQVIKAANIKHE